MLRMTVEAGVAGIEPQQRTENQLCVPAIQKTCVVDEAVDGGEGHRGIRKDVCPFPEWLICCDQGWIGARSGQLMSSNRARFPPDRG